uniref:Uncharacterized protein n=1 Tax=Rhizophora mucronata TaxID=61149 RepID=A0A2P2L141_RHIMU
MIFQRNTNSSNTTSSDDHFWLIVGHGHRRRAIEL